MNTLIKKLPLFQTNPRLAVFFGGSLFVFTVGFVLFLFFTYLIPSTKALNAEKELSPTSSVFVQKDLDIVQEVHIADNGMVFLKGARVDSVTSTKIIVTTSWGPTNLQWVVDTNESYYGPRHFGTSFLDSKGENISIKEIKAGDTITVSGTLDGKSSTLTLKADVIRTSI